MKPRTRLLGSGLLLAVTLSLAGVFSVQANASAGESDRLLAAKPPKDKKILKIKIDREVVMADDLMLKGRYSDAADLYRSVVNKNQKSVPAMVGLGMALAKQFKLDGANEMFNKALAADPNNAMAHSGKAMVMFNRLQSSNTTITKNKEQLLKDAEAECKAGLAIDNGMPEAHYTLGMIYKEQGRLDDAIGEFNQATQIDPQYSEAYAGLGIAKLQQNNLADAQTAFKKAISLNSGNSTAHYGLGTTYLRQNQYDDAIKELNTSLYQFPNSAPARLSMGQAYAGQGNTVGAVSAFQEAIRIKPENPDAYLCIADIREARGDLEHSIAELRSSLELMPNNPAIHERIGDESMKLEKLDDAIKEYKTCLDGNPQDANAAKGLTRAYYLKANKEATGAFFVSNEYENSKHYIEQAVQMNPNDIELRLAQAKLRSMAGEKIDLNQVGNPTNDGERVAFAEALLAQNRFKDADAQMATVINNAQTSKQAFAVADLALMIHDLSDAEAAYKKGATLPDGAERGKRGLDSVDRAKDQAKQDLTLADDLSKRKQLQSSIDKYHASIFENPRVGKARYDLAFSLEKITPPQSNYIHEAIIQYKAYLDLTPELPPKEADKLNKRLVKLQERETKLKEKEAKDATKPAKPMKMGS